MIRWGVFGGRWGPVPWQALVAVGAALLGSAGLLVLLTWGSPFFWIRELEAIAAFAGGVAVLGVGLVRRARAPPATPPVE